MPRTEEAIALDVRRIYDEYAEFVWASLSRLGVRDADLEDLMQEVFLVVHRRLDSFEGEGSMRSWLYSICRRSASNYRRRAFHTRECPTSELEELEISSDAGGPEDVAVEKQARARLDAVLARLSDDKRVVFVMFEIELKTPAEIAAALEIPVGTVHSRIFSARRDVERIAAKLAVLPPLLPPEAKK